MRKVKKNRLLALLLMGLLLFSNYGIMAYADEIPASEIGSQDSADKESADKESADKESADKESADKESADKESADKESADKESADKESADKESADKESADKESADKESADKESADKESADKESADKESADKESADKESADKDAAGQQKTVQELATQEPPRIVEEKPAKVEVVGYVEEQNVGNIIIEKEVTYIKPGTFGETITEIVPGKEDKNDKAHETAVFDLKNTKNPKEDVTAYCNDIDTPLKENSKYSVQELSTNIQDTETSEKLRGIVLNGYDPNIGLTSYQEELKDKALGFLSEDQINKLSEKDVIAATQIAIWKLENPDKKFVDYDWERGHSGKKKIVEDENVVKLAEYLSKQKESDPSKNNLKIEAKATDENAAVKLENGEVSVNYTYSILNRVNEQVQTFLEVFVNDKQLADDAYKVVDLGNGNKSLSIDNLINDKTKNADIKAEIVIKGTYTVEDVYDLVPTKDNRNTQRLVSTPMLMSYNLPTLKQMFKIEYTAPVVPEEPPVVPEEPPVVPEEPPVVPEEPPVVPEEPPVVPEEPPVVPEEPPVVPEEPPVVPEEPPVVPEEPPVVPEEPPVIPGGGGGTTNPPVVEPQPEPTNPTPQPTTPIAQNDNDDDDEDIEDEATPLAAPQIIPVASPVATLASVEQTEEVIDEETPLSAPPVIETEEEIIEEEVPLNAPAPVLPKTGGFAPELLYALGASLIATGLKIRKK